MKWLRMKKIRQIDEQIKKLREMRKKWANGTELTDEQMARRSLTLDLLDGAIKDLQKRKKEIQKGEE